MADAPELTASRIELMESVHSLRVTAEFEMYCSSSLYRFTI